VATARPGDSKIDSRTSTAVLTARRGRVLFSACAIASALITGCSSLEPSATPPEVDAQTGEQPTGLRPCDVATERAVGDTIGSQIDALREGDFETAYVLAAPDFQAGVPLDAFETIIRRGFPGLLDASNFTLSGCLVDPSQSLAETVVTLRTADEDVITLRYQVRELPEGWRILGATPVAPVSQGT
jgi:hypothetical protein